MLSISVPASHNSWGGRYLQRYLVSPSLFKQGYLKQVCPGPSEDGFGISPSRETAQPPRVICAQCLVTPLFLMFREPPCVCAPWLCSCHWALQKRVSPPLLPPFRDLHWLIYIVLIYIDDILPEPSFLQARRSQAFPHRIDAPVHSSPWWTFGGFSPLCPCVLCTGEPRNEHRTPSWCLLTSAE